MSADPFDYAYDEEALMKPPTGHPCRECPWRRVSAPGWLGPHSAEHWVEMAHGDGQIACHMTIPPDSDDDNPDIASMTTCSGSAIFRRNVCKSPRTLRGLPEYQLPDDREAVFGWNNEFLAHHTREEDHG